MKHCTSHLFSWCAYQKWQVSKCISGVATVLVHKHCDLKVLVIEKIGSQKAHYEKMLKTGKKNQALEYGWPVVKMQAVYGCIRAHGNGLPNIHRMLFYASAYIHQ